MTTHAKHAPAGYETILEAVRQEPGITAPQLAEKVKRLKIGREILQVLRDAFQIAIEDAAPAETPEDGWGEAPTAEQLSAARAAREDTRTAVLGQILDGALTREQAAVRLGVTAQAVSERLKARKLIALRRGREWRLPVWQFGMDDALPGLADLITAWPGTPIGLSAWATTPSPDLDGRTPAEMLARRDGVERVLALVEAISAAAW